MKPKASFIALFAGALLAFGVSSVTLGKGAAEPAATEANITRVTVGLLERSQFARHSLDDELANAFLERYLDVLDAQHLLFLQSDVRDFSAHRATLAKATRNAGDTEVAHLIFARYEQRLEQRAAFVKELLDKESFEFTGSGFYALDREQAPRPADMQVARELWRQQLRAEYLQEKLAAKTPAEIVDTLTRRSDRQLQRVRHMNRDGVLELWLSALAYVYDPHSDYLGHEQLAEFAIAMKLSLFGIGARLRSEGRGPKIVEVLVGGPAARSGQLEPGDRIVAVAQGTQAPVDVVDLPLSKAVAMIRGPKGSVVKLTVVPASAGDDAVRKIVSLVRDEIQLEAQRATAEIVDMPDDDGALTRIGVISLPSFYADLSSGGNAKTRTQATTDVEQLLNKLKAENVQAVVLDLRRNGGGSLDESIKLTGLFIKQGPVVQTRGFNGDIEVEADNDSSVNWNGPLVVLTSRFSASASEILAGALQDYGRAVIVGASSTYGKGTVQSLVPLASIMDRSGLKYSYDPGALKVTVRKFYRPSGASTQLRGVVPDIVLPSLSNRSDVGEAVLDKALKWDSVPAVDFDALSMVGPYLPTLRDASARRVQAARGFAYLRDEVNRLEVRIKDRTVSLNEAARRQEIADLEARKNAYESALEALGDPLPTTWQLSLREAAMPGLPPPVKFSPQANSASGSDSGSSSGASAAAGANEADPDAESEQGPQGRDVVLNEAKRIASDYVALLRANGELAQR